MTSDLILGVKTGLSQSWMFFYDNRFHLPIVYLETRVRIYRIVTYVYETHQHQFLTRYLVCMWSSYPAWLPRGYRNIISPLVHRNRFPMHIRSTFRIFACKCIPGPPLPTPISPTHTLASPNTHHSYTHITQHTPLMHSYQPIHTTYTSTLTSINTHHSHTHITQHTPLMQSHLTSHTHTHTLTLHRVATPSQFFKI